MRAIIYVRISADRGGQQAGVTRQREDCEGRALERNWQVVAVEADNDISATSGKRRPGFEAVIRALEERRVDVILAWSLDRLQRSRRDEVRLYEACRTAGATLALVNGADLDFSTAAGRFVADSLGSVARFEVELKSDRQKRASLQAAQAGKRAGGRRPFGYEPDGLTIRLAEAEALRRGYVALLAGVSLGEIARMWNAAGFVTGQKRWKGSQAGQPSPWHRDSVRTVLQNPRNAGYRAYLGEVVAVAEWPAVVEESTWQAVKAVLDDPTRRRTPGSGRAMLSGLAVCSVCGATVNSGGGRTGFRTIRCSSNTHFGRAAEPVETYVGRYIVARLARPDAAELLADPGSDDVPALREESLALRSRLDSVAVEFAEGDLTAGQLRAITETLRKRIAGIDSKLADAGRTDKLGALVFADDVAAAWAAKSNGEKRAIIALLYRVIIHPAGRGVRTFNPKTVEMLPV